MSFNSPTFRLFSQKPSFINGLGSLFDISDPVSKYKMNKTEREADCESIKADWLALGLDMQEAINEYDRESKTR